MRPDDQVRTCLSRLRAAVASGGYSAAQGALNELREALQCAQAGPQAESLAHEALETLAWARKSVLAARAHDAARLARLRPAPKAYRSPSGRTRAAINLTV